LVASHFLFSKFHPLGHHSNQGFTPQFALVGHLAAAGSVSLPDEHSQGITMTPNFTIILIGSILFALPVLGFIWWRFGGPDAMVFIIVSGVFPAVMDFISSFVVRNYEYPGQSRLWVFTLIFFGWIGMCGCCLFLAEGTLARRAQDMLTQTRLWWQVPLLSGVIAVILDLFIDPVAVAAGYWVWFQPGTVYFGIPLLNFVGWFVLMFLAPLAWICIARNRRWALWQKGAVAIGALIPLFIASILLSLVLNSAIAALGLR